MGLGLIGFRDEGLLGSGLGGFVLWGLGVGFRGVRLEFRLGFGVVWGLQFWVYG